MPKNASSRSPSSRGRQRPVRRSFRSLPRLEQLENRLLLSAGDSLATAIDLPLLSPTSHASGYLADRDSAVLYRIPLAAGDVVRASADTSRFGGGLNSYLRVFQGTGEGARAIASNDDLVGRDPGLLFQAAATGTYYLGLSSFDNTAYDPAAAGSGHGSSHGLFALTVTKSAAAPRAWLVGSAFRGPADAVAGENFTVGFTVENRGAETSAPTTVSLLPSADNRFTRSGPALAALPLPALAPGGSWSGSFTAPLDWADGPLVYLGLQIGESGPNGPTQGNDWQAVRLLHRELDLPPGTAPNREAARDIGLGSRVGGTVFPASGGDFFKVTLTTPGVLTARLDAGGRPVALTLYDANGGLIVRSDGQTSDGPLISHLLPGEPGEIGTEYYLEVSSRGAAATPYELTTLFAPSVSSPTSIPVAAGNRLIVRADFNADGVLDFATTAFPDDFETPGELIAVYQGNGDGTFARADTLAPGAPASALAVGDFDEDGRPDLVSTFFIAEDFGQDVRVRLSGGDGTFAVVAALGGTSLAVGDFNGDGHLDLAVAGQDKGSIDLLLGDGHGGFAPGVSVPVFLGVGAVVAADLDGDGDTDLAASYQFNNEVKVLANRGDGTFDEVAGFSTGDGPFALTSGDFDSDGVLDLATANLDSGDVTLALRRGGDAVWEISTAPVGAGPRSLTPADLDGDGQLDLAVVNTAVNSVTVLLNDKGRFRAGLPVEVGVGPSVVTAGDFNGDGRVDLATTNETDHDVTLLLGGGDGTFPDIVAESRTGELPARVIQGDFNGDGRPDLAVANQSSDDVSVFLGQGDGTFLDGGRVLVGGSLVNLVAGDFNRDGRLDLATAGRLSGDVAILLGDGTGRFLPTGSVSLGGRLTGLVAADFNGDGNLDLASTDFTNSQVEVLLGTGDGTFRAPVAYPSVGRNPRALLAGDFDGDGVLDLVAANSAPTQSVVSVLRGREDGSFSPATTTRLSRSLSAMTAGDFNGDGRPDLAFSTSTENPDTGVLDHRVTVLDNAGAGTFSGGTSYDLGAIISALVAGDFDGDGHLDLAAAARLNAEDYSPANKVTLLLGHAGGGFTISDSPPGPTGPGPNSAVAGDFNGDGRLDLATANYASNTITALLGTGTGGFVPSGLAPGAVRSTPLVARLTGTAVLDAVVLTQTGQIQLRRGLTERPGAFAPPVVLNPDPRLAARDLAVVQSAGGPLLAALSANPIGAPGGGRVPRVTFYRPFADGTVAVVGSVDLPPGFLPASLASADLSGNGLGDLVITASGSDRVFVLRQTRPGIFGPATPLVVGANPSAAALADLDGDSRLDVVVTSRFSGQVSVLLNRGAGGLAAEQRFRAGAGLYGLTPDGAVESLEGTSDVALGSFDEGGVIDAVVLNRGTKSFALLAGSGTGGFLNPGRAVPLGVTPTAIVAGQFTAGDDDLDIAVLSTETNTLQIFRGDGRGGFTQVFTAEAGNQPTGLSVADVSGPGGGGPDGLPDLLIGNAYGDLLIVTGVGDGTFSPYQRADQRVSLAVASSPDSGQRSFYFSNRGSDRLAFRSAESGAPVVAFPTVFQDRAAGIQAPGPQAVVNVLGTQYLLVANSGANELLVYTLDADGQPIPASRKSYFTGTNPVSITTAAGATDLNRDDVPDVLIANEGSNDVSIFVGRLTEDGWSLAYRPRQSSGGLGPTSVAIADVMGATDLASSDGIPDLLVSNGQSNEVSLLASRGNGFFVNQRLPAAPTLSTGSDPVQVLVGDFDRTGGLDIVTVNRGSNDVTLISNFLTLPLTTTVPSGGTLPVAAVALDLDGSLDLLVANVGDGVFGLLRGTADGFEVVATIRHPELPHPSDLVLVDSGLGLQVYATDASQEAAVLLGTFGLPLPVQPPPPTVIVPPSPGFESGLEIVGEGTPDGPNLGGSAQPTVSFQAPESTLSDLLIRFGTKLLGAISDLVGGGVGEVPAEGPGDIAIDAPPPTRRAEEILLLNLREPDAAGLPKEGRRAEEDEEGDAAQERPPDPVMQVTPPVERLPQTPVPPRPEEVEPSSEPGGATGEESERPSSVEWSISSTPEWVGSTASGMKSRKERALDVLVALLIMASWVTVPQCRRERRERHHSGQTEWPVKQPDPD